MQDDRIEVIVFTGTRSGMKPEQKNSVKNWLKQLRPHLVIHGDCIGADAEFHDIVRELFTADECKIAAYPVLGTLCASKHEDADEVIVCKKHIERNRKMVDRGYQGSGVLIAVSPTTFELQRSGTWSTIRYARNMGMDMFISYPEA